MYWNEKQKALTFADAKGVFKPAFDRQTFTIKVISPGKEGKVEMISRKVDYSGKELKVKF